LFREEVLPPKILGMIVGEEVDTPADTTRHQVRRQSSIQSKESIRSQYGSYSMQQSLILIASLAILHLQTNLDQVEWLKDRLGGHTS